ncbi:hypothetical protein M3201_07680 [Paenibacillus motobuensis]|uniref:hypothetical protein n=1 Tax=Paenibacillus TaxID=44249 RepID=UPI0020418EDC|nr:MULTISPECIES: hypothetical protein [Paenibacillus]MCM3039579.1 hypothetical protein [Paenibacillus lutimineralis]MCM3646683.1 hypothetical protein [Paenibacillus motobuensis]
MQNAISNDDPPIVVSARICSTLSAVMIPPIPAMIAGARYAGINSRHRTKDCFLDLLD